MTEKANDAFRTISEVSAKLGVPPHVLRFWETKFVGLRPLKRSGGRRYYRPDDVAVLVRIRDLLYKDGFTIKGAQRFLKSKEAIATVEPQQPSKPSQVSPDFGALLKILETAQRRLATVKSQLNA